MEISALQMSDLQNGNNLTVCTEMAVPTVTSIPYRLAQIIHIVLAVLSIVFTVLAYYQLRKKFYFHKNIKILMIFMFASANVLALQMLIMQVGHLASSFMYTEPCELFISAKTCFPYFITNAMTIACMTGAQVSMCVERLIATYFMKKYEQMNSTIGYILMIGTISIFSLIIWDSYWGDPLDEAFLLCISIPARAAERSTLMFILLIGCNIFSIFSLIAINIANRNYRKKLRFHLADRYQIEENLASTQYICLIILLQFVIFTFYAVFTLLLRGKKSEMDEKMQRTLVMFAYSIPYFTCFLPLLLIWVVNRGAIRRGRRINKLVSHETSGDVGGRAHFQELLKQWS